MSFQTQNLGLGLAPSFLPVTGSFLLPFALFNAALQYNVIKQRVAAKVYIGDKSESSTSGTTSETADPLFLAGRVHANFLENVPLTLLFAGIVELNGGNRRALTGVLAAYLAARASHALGISGVAPLLCRQVGFFASVAAMTGLAGWAGWLAKGYWGF